MTKLSFLDLGNAKQRPRVKSPLLALSLCALIIVSESSAQRQTEARAPLVFTHADTLRGMLTPERRCYDVKYYHLDVRIDPATRFLDGSNTIYFRVDSAFDRM